MLRLGKVLGHMNEFGTFVFGTATVHDLEL